MIRVHGESDVGGSELRLVYALPLPPNESVNVKFAFKCDLRCSARLVDSITRRELLASDGLGRMQVNASDGVVHFVLLLDNRDSIVKRRNVRWRGTVRFDKPQLEVVHEDDDDVENDDDDEDEFFQFDRELLQCPICLDTMRCAAVTSPCGHSFCSSCVRASLSHSDQGQAECQCPLCRGVISATAPNYALRRLCQQPRLQLTSSAPVTDERADDAWLAHFWAAARETHLRAAAENVRVANQRQAVDRGSLRAKVIFACTVALFCLFYWLWTPPSNVSIETATSVEPKIAPTHSAELDDDSPSYVFGILMLGPLMVVLCVLGGFAAWVIPQLPLARLRQHSVGITRIALALAGLSFIVYFFGWAPPMAAAAATSLPATSEAPLLEPIDESAVAAEGALPSRWLFNTLLVVFMLIAIVALVGIGWLVAVRYFEPAIMLIASLIYGLATLITPCPLVVIICAVHVFRYFYSD
jgi:Zinc finger, C3HC4 type (RING finger)